MPPLLALILCVGFVAVLLRFDRLRNPEASWGLWVPTLLMLICASRPVGRWIDWYDRGRGVEGGSPADQITMGILVFFALIIVFSRKINCSGILKDNSWLIFLYLFLALSILWSDFQFISLRRWVRLVAAIPIALVLMGEKSPLKAFESVLRRCAYVLIPFSILLIKYYPNLGVEYERWSGIQMWIGVSTQKNGLGQLCAISILFLIWTILPRWRSDELKKKKYLIFADIFVIGMALHLLRGPGSSYSATAIGVLIIGIGLLFLLYRSETLGRWMALRLKPLVIIISIGYILFGDSLLPILASFSGRDETLTGRTDIWNAILVVASRKPLLGTGYGGFWGMQNEITSAFKVGQAHNGYLGVYLELGIVGVGIFSAFLLALCGKIRREVEYLGNGGVFGTCFLLMMLLYNFTEDTNLAPSFIWTTTVFLTVVFSEPYLKNQEIYAEPLYQPTGDQKKQERKNT